MAERESLKKMRGKKDNNNDEKKDIIIQLISNDYHYSHHKNMLSKHTNHRRGYIYGKLWLGVFRHLGSIYIHCDGEIVVCREIPIKVRDIQINVDLIILVGRRNRHKHLDWV